jgi:DNA-binding transcriptional ArsR family regulator
MPSSAPAFSVLTNNFVNGLIIFVTVSAPLLEVQVIDDPAAAVVALQPVRSRLLSELAKPASAANLSARLGIARQKINYHLRALEAHDLVRVAEKRQWGGLTERVLVATAASYIVSPAAMGPVAADPARGSDRLSAGYLIALAARIVREVKRLLDRAHATSRRLPTLSIDSVIRFRSAADRAAFSRDLTAAVTSLAARYHDESAPEGRPHRLVVVAYPLLQNSQDPNPHTPNPYTKEPS